MPNKPKLPDTSGPLFKYLGHFNNPTIKEQGHNPATSVAQRKFLAMCEHGKIPASRCPKMSKEQYRHFTRTKEKGLPKHAK